MLERWHVKLLAIVITLVLMLLVVFIPFKIMACFNKLGNRGIKILVTLNCFTGGVFLGTCLLFLVPEVFHLMTEPYYGFEHFPIAETTIGVGFMFIMFLERLVHTCKREKVKKVDRQNQTDDNNCTVPNKYDNNIECGLNNYTEKNGKPKYYETQSVELEECLEVEEPSARTLAEENATKAIILFLALALDEFLGGVSLGLQRTSGAVWGVLVGLLAHECVVGFSYGLQLAGLAYKKRCLSYTLGIFYAFMSPVGSVVGMLIGEFIQNANINFVNGILQGLATGVFLYVTFFEILEGKVHAKSPYKDLIAVAVGFLIMVFIALIPKDGNIDSTYEYILENTDTYNQTTISHR